MAKAASSGANLGFEATLFQVADKLRGSMDASEYKHVALGQAVLAEQCAGRPFRDLKLAPQVMDATPAASGVQ